MIANNQTYRRQFVIVCGIVQAMKENSRKEIRNQLSKAQRIVDLDSGSYSTKSNGINGVTRCQMHAQPARKLVLLENDPIPS